MQEKVYEDNLEASVVILKKIAEKWKDLSVKQSSLDTLTETLRSFKNMVLLLLLHLLLFLIYYNFSPSIESVFQLWSLKSQATRMIFFFTLNSFSDQAPAKESHKFVKMTILPLNFQLYINTPMTCQNDSFALEF